MNERPPARLNGKQNPAYRQWYWAHNPDKYRAQYEKQKAREHESNKRVYEDECKCDVCRMVFKRDDAMLRGFRFLRNGGHHGICADCL